jgi:hypothetical protein
MTWKPPRTTSATSLLPDLRDALRSTGSARVVVVSSAAHKLSELNGPR